MGRIDTLSLGGALAFCRERFERSTEMAMLFQLPTNFRIHAFGQVIYAASERNFGVAFVDMDHDARLHLEEFTRKKLGYGRRSSRVPYRTRLIVGSDSNGSPDGEPADTVLVSRNGGLLVCHATYIEGQEVYLWSPERRCGVRARVAFQQVWIPGRMVEVGFEFLTNEDFWKIDFVGEYD